MRTTARHRPRRGGYILIEAVVSLGLLSVSVVAIQGSLRQAVLVKGEAQDYTMARFILEEQIAKVEQQRQLTEISNSGRGKGDLSRFRWTYKITKIPLPEPNIPPHIPPEKLHLLELNAPYMAKIEATVAWTRAGVEHEEKLETLWIPEKLWTPPRSPRPLPGDAS